MRFLQLLKKYKLLMLSISAILLLSSFKDEPILDKIKQRLKYQYAEHPREKVYVHTSRDIYVSGEKMFFNAWVVFASDHAPSNISNRLVVQLFDVEKQKVILNKKINVQKGITTGYLELPATLLSGKYKLQAYTPWMLNFNDKTIFDKNIIIYSHKNESFEVEIPVEKPTVKFKPESGKLIRGLPSKVAFELKNKKKNDGVVSGHVIDNKGDTVTSFESNEDGVGAFLLLPKKKRSYFASYNLNSKSYKEPLEVAEDGNVMALSQTEDWVNLRIQSPEKKEGMYSIAFFAGRGIWFAAEGSFEKKPYFFVKVPKKDLPKGLVQVALINPNGKIENRRLFFNNKSSKSFEILVDKKEKNRREKVNLAIELEDEVGNNTSYIINTRHLSEINLTLDDENLVSYLLLNSELSENISNPVKFINSADHQSLKSLDYFLISRNHNAFSDKILFTDSEIVISNKPKMPKTFYGNVQMKDGSSLPDSCKLSIYYVYKEASIQCPVNNDGKFNVYAVFDISEFDKLKFTVVDRNDVEVDAIVNIESTPEFIPKYNKITSREFVRFNEAQQKVINKLLLRNKIIKEYAQFKPKEEEKFKGDRFESFDYNYKILLKDFVEFPNMELVIREILPGVIIRKRGEKYILKLSSGEEDEYFKNAPLILVDNIPINDINFLASIDPKVIEEIKVLTKPTVRGIFGISGYGGIVAFFSKQGSKVKNLGDFDISKPLEVIEDPEEYYTPNYSYSKNENSKRPDFRLPLFHDSGFIISNERKVVSFYTSDEIGTYKVEIQGVTTKGEVLYKEEKFDIIPLSN